MKDWPDPETQAYDEVMRSLVQPDDDDDLLPGFVPEEHYAPPTVDWSVPMDPFCKRTPEQIEDYTPFAQELGITNTEYVIREEGTLNPRNGHFACDSCYIELGQPSSPTGWKAP